MLVHVFGAYFGLMVSCVLRNNRPEKESVCITLPTPDLFSVMGIFLNRRPFYKKKER